MTQKKKITLLVTAIIALVAVVAGASYAAWDNGHAKKDMDVAIGGRVALTATVDTSRTDSKKLVPAGQLDLLAKPADYTDNKTLGTITVSIDAEHTADALAFKYNVQEIFAVPADKSLNDALTQKKALVDAGKSAQDIAAALKANGIIDLNVEHEYTDASSVVHKTPRYVTTKPAAGTTPEEGTDLLINFVGADTGALAADTKLAFNTTGLNDAAQVYTISIEFLRKAGDEFVTYEDFVNKKIVIQFYMETVVL